MTDHASEARKILHEATHDEKGRVPEELLDDYEARNLALWWQEAQIHATLAIAEQLRIGNRLKVAEIDLTEELFAGGPVDFRIRPYLTPEDWASIEVTEGGGDD